MASHDISQEIQDNVLSCPICNNQLREPKALPCLHTYCCKCLQELARRAENGRRRLQCPECRKTVVVPAQGVQAFPTNYLVANVLEKVQQCKEEKKKQANETDMCDVHKQEAQVVCYTCNVVVCTACLKSDHKEHVLKHIDQEKAAKVKQVEKLIKETTHVSGDLSPVKQRLEEKHKEVRTQIESWTRVVIRRVKDQEKSLLEKLGQIKERKLEEIGTTEMQHDELKRKMRAAKLSAEEAINGNRQLLYKDILSHYSSLTDAMSERAEYHAKQAPLLREAGCLKFEKSKVPVDQPLLGHIVKESDGPSGSKPPSVVRSNTSTSDNTDKADTFVRGRDLLVARDEQKTRRRNFWDSSEDDLDDTVSIPDPKRQKKINIPRRVLTKIYHEPPVHVSPPVSPYQASPSASTSRSSPSHAARPGASPYPTSDSEDDPTFAVGVRVMRLCNPELGEGDYVEEELELALIGTMEV